MKSKKYYFIVVVCMVLFIYITNIDKIPKEIILFQDESYEISCLKGIEMNGDNLSTSSSLFRNLAKIKSSVVGTDSFTVSAFGGVMKKDVSVNVLPATSVVLGGDTIGIRLYSEGVLVIGEMPIQSIDGSWHKPYSETKIEIGDVITKVNKQEVETIEELVAAVNLVEEGKSIEIEYIKNNDVVIENITPIKSYDDGKLKLGLWVRDGAMGVGTLTFYNPKNQTFAALGHGVSDLDAKDLINVESGLVNIASVLDVKKGKKNSPGEIKGLLLEEFEIGKITGNNENGIFGEFEDNKRYFRGRREVQVASRNEITVGKASIYCTVDNENKPKEYEVEIQKIFENSSDTRGMILKVTDEDLINKTGGIVQGMSGSPIVQNGKLVGAVTHVYVSDPTKGYGIFIENMM
ncbi:MAG: SpoIVB peptidase [Clostridia bacterium]|nr:SpoIVB peptidase [Clostridia bacterium]